MGTHWGTSRCSVRAGRLQSGDRVLLDGFTREVVHVERFGVRVGDEQTGGTTPQFLVCVSFVNGSSITVSSDQVFDVVTPCRSLAGGDR